MEEKVDEMKELALLDEEFSKEKIMNMLKELENLGREVEVGGQTSYQNLNFVLNKTEFPEGTSGNSRQAVFEGAVRVDSLKGLVFDYHKELGETKIKQAQIMRAEEKLNNPKSTPADKLEAEGELQVAKAELRQKELALDGMKFKSKYLLRSINDFYQAYQMNEELCQKRGFSILDWNKEEVEHDYWTTVNDRKLVKHEAYRLAALSKETGDSLPLQNTLDVRRVKAISDEVQRVGLSSPQPKISSRQMEELPTNWTISINGTEAVNVPDGCPYRDGKKCTFRKAIIGMCDYLYCQSLGHVLQ